MLACRMLAFFVSLSAAGFGFAPVSHSKTPGETHCYNAICHRVLTLDETRAEIGAIRRVVASYYDLPALDPYNPSIMTSSGETFRADLADNTASPIYPDGTTLLLWNEATRMAAVVRVNNTGPYHPHRELDVSRALAERLGFAALGTAAIHVVVLQAPSPAESSYRRGRRYQPLPGALGRYTDIGHAVRSFQESEQDVAPKLETTAAQRVVKPSRPCRCSARVIRRALPRRMANAVTGSSRLSRASTASTWTGTFND